MKSFIFAYNDVGDYMKPYNETNLPIAFKYDLELMKLLGVAKEKNAKYCAMLEYTDVPSELLLKPVRFQEAFKSMELSGNTMSQSSLYYFKYGEMNILQNELLNYFQVLENFKSYLTKTFKLSVGYLNRMHQDIFYNQELSGRELGKYRQKINWIGSRGKSMYEAEYVPTHPFDIPIAMSNFIKYFNKGDTIDFLLDMAVSHAQFENIHPYKDGNGRLGRLLIPIQSFIATNSIISLFLSEAIKNNEYAYYEHLKQFRMNQPEKYLKFFLKLVIEQLDLNINRISESIKIYHTDKELFLSLIGKKNGALVYDYVFANITSTIKEASNDLNINYQTIRNYYIKLNNAGVFASHKIQQGEHVYTYIKMYQVFVPIDWL